MSPRTVNQTKQANIVTLSSIKKGLRRRVDCATASGPSELHKFPAFPINQIIFHNIHYPNLIILIEASVASSALIADPGLPA